MSKAYEQYSSSIMRLLQKITETEGENIKKAGRLIAEALSRIS